MRAQLTDAWVRCALALVPQMERAGVRARVLPFAMARAAQHEAAGGCGGRLACAALLGAAAPRLTREDVELGCLAKAVALCQVRADPTFKP